MKRMIKACVSLPHLHNPGGSDVGNSTVAASPSERVREFWMWPHRRVEAMLRSNQSNHKPTRWLDGDNFTHNNRVRSTIETCWVGNTAMVEQRRKSRTRDGGGSPLSSHRSLTSRLTYSVCHGFTLARRWPTVRRK